MNRPGAALLLILLYGGVSTARWVHRARPAGPAQDEITAYESRFRLLRSALPARGVVGYLGYPEPTGTTPQDSNAAASIHLTAGARIVLDVRRGRTPDQLIARPGSVTAT